MKKRTSSVVMYTIENITRIAVIFIFSLVFVVMLIAVFDDNSAGEANIGSFNTYTFDKHWQLNDGDGKREVSLPAKLPKTSSKHVTISNTLPYDVTEGMSMMIRSSMEDVKIYIDGELREDYSSDSLEGMGYYIPSAYVVVQLDAEDASKPILISFDFKSAHVINEIKLSYGNNVWFDVIREDFVITFIALFTLILGISLHVGAAIIKTNFKSDSAKVLGLLMATIALWVISESKLRQFIFQRPSLAHLFSFILIELVGVMACMYFDEVQHNAHHKSYLVAEVIVLVQLFLNVILHATGVAEFYQTMAFSHFWAALCAIVGITNIIIDIGNGNAKKYSIIMYGMICFIFLALAEIIGFYRTPYHILGLHLGLALLILTICTVIQTIHDEVAKYRQREINYTQTTINTIETIASSIDARDEYTGGHSERVGLYAERLAREMAADYDFTEEDIKRIRYIGLVHDIGKIGVSDGVLNKKGRLTIEEYDEMKRHTKIGYEIMKPLGSGIDGLLDGIKYHHERFDGKGYPEHLSDTDIPLVARIIAIADCYDAMTTNRRVIFFIDDLDRLNPEKAVEILEVLKNFLDCKNCVFVLAIDYDVVCRGVASKYKFNPDDPKSNKKGKDFFDKIIQVPFKMPVEQYNITAYMKQLLESVNVKNEKLMNDADNYEQYENLVKASIGTNPRAIKRLVNSYQLIAIVVGFNNEIDIHDKKMKLLLFATLCLQELDLNVYRLVAQNKNNLRAEHLMCFTDAATNPIDEVYEDIEIKDIDQDRVEVFMQLLIDILKKDNKTAIEDEDLLPFITILKFASITGNDAPSIEIKKGTAETRNSVDELKNVIDKDAFNKMSIIIQEEAGIKATLMDRPNDAKITAFIGGTNKIKVEFFEKKTGGFTLWCEARSAFFDEGNFPADIEAVLSNRNATRTKPIKKNFTSKNSLNKYFSFAVSLPDDEADIRAILRGCKESL